MVGKGRMKFANNSIEPEDAHLDGGANMSIIAITVTKLVTPSFIVDNSNTEAVIVETENVTGIEEIGQTNQIIMKENTKRRHQTQ